jgi:hypothetical protein
MVFGREEERARLEELLDSGRLSLSNLALEGVPGIGNGVPGSWPLTAVLRASSRASPTRAPTGAAPVGLGSAPSARSSA